MSDVLSRELPAPRRWQELESLAFDVFGRLWKTTDAELHGRTGQQQAGVDVYGTNRVEQLFTGVQCKGKDADYGGVLTEDELRSEITKALTFEPPLEAYVVLTTAPNDVAIQKLARKISADHKMAGLFEVRVTGWDTFRHHVASYPDLLTKYFADFAPVDVVAQISSLGQQQAQGLVRVETMFRASQKFLAEIRDEQSNGDQLAARIHEIGRFITDGAPRAALTALDRVEAEEGDAASPLARYRLLASKGNAHIALGEDAKAAKFYRAAYAANPEFANAKATLALATHVEGDRTKAFDLASAALKDDPLSMRNAGILIDLAPIEMSIPELEALLDPAVLADGDVKLHLAIHAAISGDHKAHRRFAEDALAACPGDWRAMSELGAALMQPLSVLDGVALTHAIPDAYVDDVGRATQLMSEAWAKLAGRESAFQGRHVAANLIGLLEASGREDEAFAILDEALARNPTFGPLVVRAARRSAGAGDWRSVAQAIDSIAPAEDVSFDGLLIRTQAAIESKVAADAFELCDRLVARSALEPELPERDQLIAALRVRAEILGGADRTALVEAAIDAQPDAIVLRSILFDEIPPEDPLRARLTDEIGALSKRELTLHERVHAAETLYEAGQFGLAADLYKPLHGTVDSPALRRRLKALFNADRRGEARKLFESLPKALRTTPGYVTLGISIYERAGLLKPALTLIDEALKTDDRLQLRLAWMNLLVRLGRPDRYQVWLKQVSEVIEGMPGELMALARTIDQQIGRDPRALKLGYRALRAGYSRPRMHMNYAIGLVLMGKPPSELLIDPSFVAEGTGVELRNEATGDMLFRLIETDPGPVIERGELSPSDPFAARILGLKVDDTVEIARIGADSETYRVVAIQSRYLFAHLRTIRDFQTLFPGNTMFGSVQIDDAKGDARFEPMFAMARQRADQCSQIESMYRESPLPLAMVAKFTGANVFELWDAFSSDVSLGLKSAIGVAEEFAAGRRLARQGVLVVDPVSIYAWVRMGIAPSMLKSGAHLAVVQSTIDALRELAEERKGHRGQKMGSFGWDGEHYRLNELTDETLDRQIADAQAALAAALSLMVVPAEGDASLPGRIADFVDEFHPAYRDTLLAASQANRGLLTDDLGLRVIAQEAGANITFTQAVAQAGHGAQALSHPEYGAVVAGLVDANYIFTQFSAHELLGELRENQWAMNDRLGSYIRLMMSPVLDRNSIAGLLSEFLMQSDQVAPDPQAFARFHIAYAEAMRDAGMSELLRKDYDAALEAAFATLTRNINRIILKQKLLGSTSRISPIVLAEDSRRLAERRVRMLWQHLVDGGFDLDDAGPSAVAADRDSERTERLEGDNDLAGADGLEDNAPETA